MVFFVRITVNQSHLRPICKSTKFNPKIQRTIYLINFQQLRLHVPDFIRTVVHRHISYDIIYRNAIQQNITRENGRVVAQYNKGTGRSIYYHP